MFHSQLVKIREKPQYHVKLFLLAARNWVESARGITFLISFSIDIPIGSSEAIGFRALPEFLLTLPLSLIDKSREKPQGFKDIVLRPSELFGLKKGSFEIV